MLDLLGIAASGRRTDLSRIIHDHAAEQFGGASLACRLIFDGRSVSPTGAALAGATTIHSVEPHDGLKPTKAMSAVACCHLCWQSQTRPNWLTGRIF
jgi:2-methylcitrate dehydratase PrpD